MNVKREIKELSLLFEISQILSRSMDLSEVLEPVLRSMAERLEMLRGTITLLNRETGEIYIEEAYGLSERQRERGKYRIGEGITGKVIETGEPAVVKDISEEPLFLNRTGARINKEDISFICVPIKIGNEIIGALSADRLFSDNISLEEDVRLLSIIASMIAQAVKLRQSAQEERQKLINENKRLKEELKERFKPSNIIGESKVMHDVYDIMARVADTDTTILLRGESGVGKELVAQAIHYNSRRSSGPFIRINCAALPENLIESELFGHEKGAFTGAITTRKGRFELANKGTLFLDEIGDLPLQTQVKLLRILQEREFERLGGEKTIRVDVRIIAATSRNLEELIKLGKFREDLYYRLNVVPIFIPPLRERIEDIPLLIEHFLNKFNKKHRKRVSISKAVFKALMDYDWPGNVRELENTIERLVVMAKDSTIGADALPLSIKGGICHRPLIGPMALPSTVAEIEKERIKDALEKSGWVQIRAARMLGITPRQIGYKIKKYRIDLENNRAGI